MKEHMMRVCICVARVVAGPVKCLWRKLNYSNLTGKIQLTVSIFHLHGLNSVFFCDSHFPSNPCPVSLFMSLISLCLSTCVSPTSPFFKLPCLFCHFFLLRFAFSLTFPSIVWQAPWKRTQHYPKVCRAGTRRERKGTPLKGGPQTERKQLPRH